MTEIKEDDILSLLQSITFLMDGFIDVFPSIFPFDFIF